MAAGSRSGDSSHCRSRRAPIGVTVASTSRAACTPHPGPERLHQLEVTAGHLVEPEEGIVPAHDRPSEVRQAGGWSSLR